MYGPKVQGFLPFWSEIAYYFWPFQSEIVVGYGRSVDWQAYSTAGVCDICTYIYHFCLNFFVSQSFSFKHCLSHWSGLRNWISGRPEIGYLMIDQKLSSCHFRLKNKRYSVFCNSGSRLIDFWLRDKWLGLINLGAKWLVTGSGRVFSGLGFDQNTVWESGKW